MATHSSTKSAEGLGDAVFRNSPLLFEPPIPIGTSNGFSKHAYGPNAEYATRLQRILEPHS